MYHLIDTAAVKSFLLYQVMQITTKNFIPPLFLSMAQITCLRFCKEDFIFECVKYFGFLSKIEQDEIL